MENLTKWQIALGILSGLVAAGAVLLAAYYFVASSYIDPGNDPERIIRRTAPKATSLQPSDWRRPKFQNDFQKRDVTPDEASKSSVWSSVSGDTTAL